MNQNTPKLILGLVMFKVSLLLSAAVMTASLFHNF